MTPTPALHILNLGAGVQSTTLYLMGLRGEEPAHVPRFDYAIFADTQEEPAAVYEHLEWLISLGGPPILVRTAGKLGDDLIRGVGTTGYSKLLKNGERAAMIPAFAKAEGDAREGIIRRQCTREYKIRVIEQAIKRDVLGLRPRQRVPAGRSVVQYMGLSFDEPRRVISTRARSQDLPWSEPRFPLWELQMTRRDCQSYLEEAAPGRVVPRSACVFCPFRSNAEWRHLRDHAPADWARAIAVDAALREYGAVATRGLDKKCYVHRSCKPLAEAPIDTPESRGEQYTFGFAQECEGMCGV